MASDGQDAPQGASDEVVGGAPTSDDGALADDADPLAAADRLLASVGTTALASCLADDVHFRSDAHGVLDAKAAVALMMERAKGASFVPGDRVMKRNLVFAWFAFEDIDGKPTAKGTWVLSMDRAGKVAEWQEFQG